MAKFKEGDVFDIQLPPANYGRGLYAVPVTITIEQIVQEPVYIVRKESEAYGFSGKQLLTETWLSTLIEHDRERKLLDSI